MGQPETLSMQAARRVASEFMVFYPESYAKRVAEIIAGYLPPPAPSDELEVALDYSPYKPNEWIVRSRGGATVANFGPDGEQAARAWLSGAPAERPQVVVILEGGTVSSAHSNVPGLDLGIIDCDEEEDYRLNKVTGLKDVVTGEPLDQEVYKTMQQHRANIAAGKLPHQIY